MLTRKAAHQYIRTEAEGISPTGNTDQSWDNRGHRIWRTLFSLFDYTFEIAEFIIFHFYISMSVHLCMGFFTFVVIKIVELFTLEKK